MGLWGYKKEGSKISLSNTRIVSEDPLLVYVDKFVTEAEVSQLLDIGNTLYSPSKLSTGTSGDAYRSSRSAGLPPSEPPVVRVGSRALSLMASLTEPSDDFGIPQLVTYEPGQQYRLHYDWFQKPMRYKDGRLCNRVASVFVFLEADCTGGETYFPRINSVASSILREGKAFQNGSFEGIMFKPIPGNALFWINLAGNGTGDKRVLHGGLPVHTGTKTGMNIWPLKCEP
ncbi:Prolyl 4-hydroxylase 2 [Penicillium rolfsii]|nr:Prolyl 4-hydroxylase 2 [Penicillium rolfsii]